MTLPIGNGAEPFKGGVQLAGASEPEACSGVGLVFLPFGFSTLSCPDCGWIYDADGIECVPPHPRMVTA